jgi:hypothetical protein
MLTAPAAAAAAPAAVTAVGSGDVRVEDASSMQVKQQQ